MNSRPAAVYRIPAVFILASAVAVFAGSWVEAATPGQEKIPSIIRGPLRSGAGRYRAALSNGRVVQGIKISGWGRRGSRPTLAGVWLFDPANPVSWIRDDGPGEIDLEGPYVEFVGGDRLPCKLSGYRSGRENPGAPQLPHVLLQPTVDVHKPGYRGSRQVRVLSRWLRRIVLSSRPAHSLSPGTVFYAAGGSDRFRSMRWSRSGVRLLLDSGVRLVPFTSIAELHLPAMDPWDTYFEQLAVLLPGGGTGRIRKVETVGGLVLTASDQRFREGQVGNPVDSRQWWHVFQPAWSLDALWLKYSTIVSRSYNRPADVPLSTFHPVRVKQKVILGGEKRWRSDRSILGSALACSGSEFMRGFGVRAFCELEFSLSDCVKSFRTGVGIDMRAGKGGCALGRVLLRDYPSLEETSLYSSGLLVGSRSFSDSGMVQLGEVPGRDRKKLVLLADPAIDRTPAGADPLDIRDLVDWLEPRLSLDSSMLHREVALRSARFVPSLDGWSRVE
ncbi:MAG: NPCBM/NEW2 domain-containing protein, partial [Planctomycetota bacterium]|nr:NPCBM/NEW2 domain-containing protein [Planctomycetota bacterium]